MRLFVGMHQLQPGKIALHSKSNIYQSFMNCGRSLTMANVVDEHIAGVLARVSLVSDEWAIGIEAQTKPDDHA